MELDRSESEYLTLGINKKVFENENFNVEAFGKYHIFNLLYSNLIDGIIERKYFDFGLDFTYLMNDELVVNAAFSKSTRHPDLIFLLDSNNIDLDVENSLNFDLGFKWLPSKYFNFGIDGYFSVLSDNIYNINRYLLSEQFQIYDDNVYGLTFDTKINLLGYILRANYTYHYSENDIYYFTPQNSIFISFLKQYDFDFQWLIEAYYSSERTSAFSDIAVADFLTTNVRLSQLISKRFEIYLRFDNIFDVYYEYIPGFPGPGFNFAAGVQIKLGVK